MRGILLNRQFSTLGCGTMNARRCAVSLALVIATSSCFLAPRGGDDDDLEPRQARDRDLTIDVQNQNFYDANIYAVYGGYRQRLGFVTGLSEKSFEFRWNRLDLQIDIKFISAGSYLTESLLVDEGDWLELRIDPGLHLKARRPDEPAAPPPFW